MAFAYLPIKGSIGIMRPMSHPAVADVRVEAILHALSDPVRVGIFAQLVRQKSSLNCSTFLRMGDRAVPKSSVSQHLKVLRDAGLITSERRGAEMHNTSRLPEVESRFPGLTAAVLRAHEIQTAEQ
jgi:DNA-binding transcriptional ArsR family regulator